jgi:hypothetical protein
VYLDRVRVDGVDVDVVAVKGVDQILVALDAAL